MHENQDLREEIHRRLSEIILPAMLVHRETAAAEAAPTLSGPAGSLIESAAFQTRLTLLISDEINAFFSQNHPNELFESNTTAPISKETLAKVQKIVVEESASGLTEQLDERFKNLVKRINLVPETLKPGWLARALSGISEEVSKNMPDLSERERVKSALADLKIQPAGQTRIKPQALEELKREITASVLGSLRLASQSQPKPTTARFVIENGGNATSAPTPPAPKPKSDPKAFAQLDALLVERLASEISDKFSALLATKEKELISHLSDTVQQASVIEQPKPAEAIATHTPVTPTTLQKYSAIRPLNPHILVLHCIDPRFQQPIREFLFQHLKLEDHEFVHLAVPGGVMGLTLENYLPKFSWALRRWIGFAADTFPLERVICVGHHDCRTYQAPRFMAFKPLYSKLSEKEKQLHDMKEAQKTLRELLPKASIELFFLDIDEHQVPKPEKLA